MTLANFSCLTHGDKLEILLLLFLFREEFDVLYFLFFSMSLHYIHLSLRMFLRPYKL
jgi:hypothetical protein